MRLLVAVGLFASVAATLAVSQPNITVAQEKKDDKKKTQPKVDPKTFIPDEATKKVIAEKTEDLRKAVAALKAKKVTDDVLIEVEIYLKAAENIVRFEEWLAAASVKWALTTLDQGLARAKQAEGGKAVWRDAPGKWVVRAYRSQVDDSIQPYAVLLPTEYGKDPKKKWRLDIVLHGRDGALTEAKFIASHGGVAPKDLGYVQLEVYGRGNNAYRWAGETDVFEAWADFEKSSRAVDRERVVLRGFSMGGAGTWHIGLHIPSEFCVIGPGAGFTTTHGYIANLPKQLPDYQEKCLHIYDAVDYTENAFNVPVVAYSGEIDAQKKAADNIETLLKNFKEPVKFTHLVAPGLAHQMPKEWQDKAEVEYRKYADKGRERFEEHVHFVTYTPRYPGTRSVKIRQLERQYEKAVIDYRSGPTGGQVRTINVAQFHAPPLFLPPKSTATITIDDQELKLTEAPFVYIKRDGKWTASKERPTGLAKVIGLHGPIDDAFLRLFFVVAPSEQGYPAEALKQFAGVWDKYFRGALPMLKPDDYNTKGSANLVLFGNPDTNPVIAKALPKLPITWTKDELVVNGVKYDPKTHVPVLIYPNPLTNYSSYVVINSGHTFKEADLKGTNALLYPRLGDWAVIKPTPTEKDPAAYEVVAAGLFDENWQFPKKK